MIYKEGFSNPPIRRYHLRKVLKTFSKNYYVFCFLDKKIDLMHINLAGQVPYSFIKDYKIGKLERFTGSFLALKSDNRKLIATNFKNFEKYAVIFLFNFLE